MMLEQWQLEALRIRFLDLPYEEQLSLIEKIKEAESSGKCELLTLPELNAEGLDWVGLEESLTQRLVRVWSPASEDFSTGSICVPNPSGQEIMSRGQYKMRLQGRLEELVKANPVQAKRLLTDSPEHKPDLYSIGMGSDWEHYGAQIVDCDQMQILLNRIHWCAPGNNRFVEAEDLRFLDEIIESMPG